MALSCTHTKLRVFISNAINWNTIDQFLYVQFMDEIGTVAKWWAIGHYFWDFALRVSSIIETFENYVWGKKSCIEINGTQSMVHRERRREKKGTKKHQRKMLVMSIMWYSSVDPHFKNTQMIDSIYHSITSHFLDLKTNWHLWNDRTKQRKKE